MQQCDAQFIVSGEVIGQRPKSQKKRDLKAISFHSELEDLLLRPLSAREMPETLPERVGWVDRNKLYGIVGRGRKELIQLAKQFGLASIPSPSTGCALTEPRFSRKVFDLIRNDPASERWDYELLRLGRHFRIDDDTKVIVGRDEEDNSAMVYMHQLPGDHRSTLISPNGFPGPRALLVGKSNPQTIDYAFSLIARYTGQKPTAGFVEIDDGESQRFEAFTPTMEVSGLETVAFY